MKVTVNNWGDGYESSGCSTTVEKADGTKLSVEFRDGEPEDFVIARDLNDALNIYQLIEAAYQAGKNGEEFEIIHDVQEEK